MHNFYRTQTLKRSADFSEINLMTVLLFLWQFYIIVIVIIIIIIIIIIVMQY